MDEDNYDNISVHSKSSYKSSGSRPSSRPSSRNAVLQAMDLDNEWGSDDDDDDDNENLVALSYEQFKKKYPDKAFNDWIRAKKDWEARK